MSEPTVCAMMLTRDRPEMVMRAVECWRAQTYEPKRLAIVDTSARMSVELRRLMVEDHRIVYDHLGARPWCTIGELRNYAAAERWPTAEVIVHWDDDDWSAPERMAEQVAFLQETGADVVGYNVLLFWRAPEAWLYTNPNPAYCCGTSLCYWRRTWQRKQFPNLHVGEDTAWLMGLKSRGDDSIDDPRMIACIHGKNTTSAIDEQHRQWRRVPQWDKWCAERVGR